MRFGLAVVLCGLFCQTVTAQVVPRDLVPRDLQDSIVGLTDAMNGLKSVLTATNTDFEKLTPNLNELSNTLDKFHNLAQSNLPQAQDSLSKAADSLKVIADFAVVVQTNQNQIIFAGIGVLAGGILIGILAATYLCIPSRDKNVFYWIYKSAVTAWAASHVAPQTSITVEPLDIL